MEKNQTILLPPEARHDKERYVISVSLLFVASTLLYTISALGVRRYCTFNCPTSLRVQVLLLPVPPTLRALSFFPPLAVLTRAI